MPDIDHPFFEQIDITDDEVCAVLLSDDFPIRRFRVWRSNRETGYVEVQANIGFVHDSGDVDWVFGTGDTFDQAVTDALTGFVNLVVHPDGLRRDQFVLSAGAA